MKLSNATGGNDVEHQAPEQVELAQLVEQLAQLRAELAPVIAFVAELRAMRAQAKGGSVLSVVKMLTGG